MFQQSSITIDRLVVTLTPKAKVSILDEWKWLIGTEKCPFIVTACGDVFVEDLSDGTIHFLDISVPKLSQVAATNQAFETLLAEPSFIERYLYPERVEMLRSKGLLLKKNQVYSFCTPLSLGGEIDSANIETTDVEVHFSIAGQIECQIAEIPVGRPITAIKIDRLPNARRWWRFW